MQCSNNFKQIGLALHNFHDTRNELVPICIGIEQPSWLVLLLPFAEQASAYEIYRDNSGSGVPFRRLTTGDFWRAITAAEQDGISSVNMYQCPSRRGSGPIYGVQDTNGGAGLGPLSDYAAVVRLRRLDGGGSRSWYRYYRAGKGKDHGSETSSNEQEGVLYNTGPLRVAEYTLVTPGGTGNGVVTTWRGRDTMAYWADGTSNQFVIGEKHIPKRNIGTAPDGYRPYDCTYIMARPDDGSSGNRAFAIARALQDPDASPSDNVSNYPIPIVSKANYFQDGKKDDGTDFGNSVLPQNSYAFGSSHPGICPFLIGDGSVRMVTSTAAVPVLAAFASVNDGEAVSLP